VSEELLDEDPILPCLIDRLTDNEPTSQKESRVNRAFSLRAFRAAVLRDLSWLLNSVTILSEEDKKKYPYVAESVLNYGISSLSGHMKNMAEEALLRASVTEAIKQFEPRIIADTLVVTIIHPEDKSKQRPSEVSLEIRGLLNTLPVPEELFIKTELDLEEQSFHM